MPSEYDNDNVDESEQSGAVDESDSGQAALWTAGAQGRGADEGWGLRLLLGLALLAAAVAAAAFSLSADEDNVSSLVVRGDAEPTAAPTATPEPTAVPTAVPTTAPTPEPAPAPAPAPAPVTVVDIAGGRDDLSTVTGAIDAAGLIDPLRGDGPFTVFAPSNDALAGVDPAPDAAALQYHVVPGLFEAADLVEGTELTTLSGDIIVVSADGSLNNGQAVVVDADLAADNGVVHVIDGVVTPLKGTLYDLIAADPDRFSTLQTLVDDNGLTAALSGPDQLTLFAPTNDAFAAADSDLLESISADPDLLLATLSHHVVEGAVDSNVLAVTESIGTLQEEILTLDAGPPFTLNGVVTLGETDLEADNGLLHVIDGVLIPPSVATGVLNQLFALNPIQFEVGSATILPESEPILDRAIDILTNNQTGAVIIEGHTDSDGGEASNQVLSENRAAAVETYLVAGGVDGDRLSSQGLGETELLVDPEVTDEDKAQNRRIEFELGES